MIRSRFVKTREGDAVSERSPRDEREKEEGNRPKRASTISLYWFLLFLIATPLMIASLNALAWKFSSPILSFDEIVEFLPTYGYQSTENSDSWNIEVAAIVFKSDRNSWIKQKFLGMVEYFSSNIGGCSSAQVSILSSRLSIFLRDFQRGKQIDIQICASNPDKSAKQCPKNKVILSSTIGPTAEDGLVKTTFTIKKSDLNGLTEVYVSADLAARDKLILDAHSSKSSRYGRRPVYLNTDRSTAVLLIPYKGVSVISDIDDTVMSNFILVLYSSRCVPHYDTCLLFQD
jgi:hypothetical protein